MVGRVSRYVVAQADGGQRYETVVQRVHVVPLGLDVREHGGGQQQEQRYQRAEYGAEVQQPDGERRVQVPETAVEEVQVLGGGYHQPVDQRGQQDQGQRYAEQRVQHAEQLALLRQRSDVTVTCRASAKKKKKKRKERHH